MRIVEGAAAARIDADISNSAAGDRMMASVSYLDERRVAVRQRRYFDDPLAQDRSDDTVVVSTTRGLCRLAMVAAETGARFQREGVAQDAMAWMIAPRSLFGGEAAIEACTGLDHFRRAIVLHGLSLGLDADPSDIDALGADGDEEFIDFRDEDVFDDACLDDDHGRDDGRVLALQPGEMRLYTATIGFVGEGTVLHAFHASLARTAGEIASRLRHRYGGDAAARATIVSGVRLGGSFTNGLVSTQLADMLRIVAADPSSPIAVGLDLNLEQRFAA